MLRFDERCQLVQELSPAAAGLLQVCYRSYRLTARLLEFLGVGSVGFMGTDQ